MIRRLMFLLAAVIAALVLPTAAAAAPDGVVKVAVVRTAEQNGGRPDSLAQVAERTLGDPNRAQEILDLNRGRAQADGGALTDAADLRPGWILKLPEDASGPDVRLGQVTDAQRPFFTWKILLAVLGTVVLALLTLLVVFRRRIVRGVRARLRAAAEKRQLRRRIQDRARLRAALAAEFAEGRGATELAYRATAELNDQNVEAYALWAGQREVTAWVTADGPPQPPWRATSETRWTRPTAGLGAPAHPAPITPCLARAGGDADGVLFADLTWLDGVLAISGDPAVASDALAWLLADLLRSRGDLRLLSVGDTAPLPSTAVRLRSVADLPVATSDTAASEGTVLLAARRRTLNGVVVLNAPASADDAARLFAFCGSGSDHVALVLGDLPGAHWRWTADPDGTLHIPVLDTKVTVPSRNR